MLERAVFLVKFTILRLIVQPYKFATLSHLEENFDTLRQRDEGTDDFFNMIQRSWELGKGSPRAVIFKGTTNYVILMKRWLRESRHTCSLNGYANAQLFLLRHSS